MNNVTDENSDFIVDRPVRMKYNLRVPNVGDLISTDIVERLTGISTQWLNPEDESEHLLAVGSALSTATKSSKMWGNGIVHPKLGLGDLDPEGIWALRGKKTLQEIKKEFPMISDVPLGDPGILAAEVFGITAHANPVYRLGVAPHYTDRKHPSFASLLRCKDVLDLNVHLSPEIFLRQMASCAAVISSSLHGLIFAESLKIPNLWVRVTDENDGEDFKFYDWYSTTAKPQRTAYALGMKEQVTDIIKMTSLRESTIDRGALKGALAPCRLEAIREEKERKFYPSTICRNRATPCFLISFNRGNFLLKTIEGLLQQTKEIDIVVHDNGSEDESTLATLEDLEAEGHVVLRNSAIENADELNKVNDSVAEYFSDWAEPQRYIVSDCDVDLSTSMQDAIEIYEHALNTFSRAEAVGPMLRISDIPMDYPLRNHAMNLHIKQFWKHLPKIVELNGNNVGSLECLVDTTLALHRAGEPFRRHKSAVRLYASYEARHLDWYLAEDEVRSVSRDGVSEISHWGDAKWNALYSKRTLKYPGFFNVVETTHDEMNITWISLSDAPLVASRRLLKNRLKLISLNFLKKIGF